MDNSYFSRIQNTYEEHPDLINWIEADPQNPLNQISKLIDPHSSVLDVGCGAGLLGRIIKRKYSSVTVSGIDPALNIATPGLSVYQNFYQGYLESALDLDWIKNNKYYVFADVIEHIPYPDIVLKKLINVAPKDASFIFSIPNVAYYRNRLDLLNGSWIYTDSGILEKTHVRFYTFESFLQLLSYIGLFLKSVYHLNRLEAANCEDVFFSFRNILALFAMSGKGSPFCYQFIVEATLNPDLKYEIHNVGQNSKINLFVKKLRGIS